jgi:outer membrane protein, heavy metal efflux system
MKWPSRSLAFSCLMVLAASGCAGLSRDSGFSDVERLVGERTGEGLWQAIDGEEDVLSAKILSLLREELTAREAVRIALLNNASLQASMEELGVDRAELVQAGLLRNPVVSAAIRFPDQGSGTNLEFSLVQEILSVLSLPRRRRVAAARFEQLKLRTADTALAIAYEAEAAFYTLQGWSQVLANQLMLEEMAEIAQDVAQRLHQAGNITDLALARQGVSFAQARVARMRAETEYELAGGELRIVLGLTPDAEVVLASRLPELPAAEIPITGLEKQALADRLDLAVARMEEQALAERAAGTRLATIQPDLELGVEAEKEADSTWLIGPKLSATVPLFDFGQAAVAGEQGRLRLARRQAAALELQVRSEVRQAYQQLLAAHSQAAHYRTVLLPLLAAVVDETQLQFNAMQLGIFALLQAKQEHLAAEGEYARLLQDYWVSRARLARVAGGGLPPPSPPPAEPESMDELFRSEPPVDPHRHNQ